MKHTTRLLLILALTTTAASGLPISSYAGGGDVARPAALQTTATGGPTQNGWVGGVAAVGCGFGIRYRVLGGRNPYYVAATVIMCLIALADGMKG